MLTISGLTKAHGARTLFADVSLTVNRGDRLGLVGANGTGKTTLFSIILGQESCDAGTVSLLRSARVGYLPQESAPVGNETVLELAMGVNIASAGAAGDEHHAAFDTDWHLREARAKRMLAGLAFRERDHARPARTLSGGWVMRAHLARLLTEEPDLLLLDEPTNHLDLEALEWFQAHLQDYGGAVLVISHDREFLNQLVGSILEIRHTRLWRYRGNYEDYLAQRDAQEEQQWAAYTNQQREIGRLMRFVERFRAKNTKASQAQSKLKQIERMEKVDAPVGGEKEISFSFPQPPRSGLRVIRLANVDHAYGELTVYRGLEFVAERGQRIALVGPNGAGKSTLLKLLAETIPVQRGERILGANVRCGYYAQYRIDNLSPEHTVLEEALNTPQRVTEEFVRTVLGCFRFSGDDVFKRVRVLSGGEKSRLALVKLLLDPPNLLLMDEPTTHLDMPSIEALLGALEQYEGTLIFISHDVYFIRTLANHVVRVENGRLAHFPGPYQYYLDKTATQRSETAARLAVPSREAQPGREGPTRREQRRLEATARQQRSRERRAQQEVVTALEQEIARLESSQQELTAELENPATYEKAGRAQHVNRELSAVVDELERLNQQWEAAAARLAALEPLPADGTPPNSPGS